MQNDNMYKSIQQHLWVEHVQELKSYMDDPTTFPYYQRDWMEFITNKTTRIISLGGDPSMYDYKSEFQINWQKKLEGSMKIKWRVKEKLSKKYYIESSKPVNLLDLLQKIKQKFFKQKYCMKNFLASYLDENSDFVSSDSSSSTCSSSYSRSEKSYKSSHYYKNVKSRSRSSSSESSDDSHYQRKEYRKRKKKSRKRSSSPNVRRKSKDSHFKYHKERRSLSRPSSRSDYSHRSRRSRSRSPFHHKRSSKSRNSDRINDSIGHFRVKEEFKHSVSPCPKYENDNKHKDEKNFQKSGSVLSSSTSYNIDKKDPVEFFRSLFEATDKSKRLCKSNKNLDCDDEIVKLIKAQKEISFSQSFDTSKYKELTETTRTVLESSVTTSSVDKSLSESTSAVLGTFKFDIKDRVSNLSLATASRSDIRKRVSDLPLASTTKSDNKERVSDLTLATTSKSVIKERVSDLTLATTSKSVIKKRVSDLPLATNSKSDIKERVSDLTLATTSKSDIKKRVCDLPIATSSKFSIKERVSDLPLATTSKSDIKKKVSDLPLATTSKSDIKKKVSDMLLASTNKSDIKERISHLPLATTTKSNNKKRVCDLPIATTSKFNIKERISELPLSTTTKSDNKERVSDLTLSTTTKSDNKKRVCDLPIATTSKFNIKERISELPLSTTTKSDNKERVSDLTSSTTTKSDNKKRVCDLPIATTSKFNIKERVSDLTLSTTTKSDNKKRVCDLPIATTSKFNIKERVSDLTLSTTTKSDNKKRVCDLPIATTSKFNIKERISELPLSTTTKSDNKERISDLTLSATTKSDNKERISDLTLSTTTKSDNKERVSDLTLTTTSKSVIKERVSDLTLATNSKSDMEESLSEPTFSDTINKYLLEHRQSIISITNSSTSQNAPQKKIILNTSPNNSRCLTKIVALTKDTYSEKQKKKNPSDKNATKVVDVELKSSSSEEGVVPMSQAPDSLSNLNAYEWESELSDIFYSAKNSRVSTHESPSSVNQSDHSTVEATDNSFQNVSFSESVNNSGLSSIPSTGGIELSKLDLNDSSLDTVTSAFPEVSENSPSKSINTHISSVMHSILLSLKSMEHHLGIFAKVVDSLSHSFNSSTFILTEDHEIALRLIVDKLRESVCFFNLSDTDDVQLSQLITKIEEVLSDHVDKTKNEWMPDFYMGNDIKEIAFRTSNFNLDETKLFIKCAYMIDNVHLSDKQMDYVLAKTLQLHKKDAAIE